jgi:hypothetical protein
LFCCAKLDIHQQLNETVDEDLKEKMFILECRQKIVGNADRLIQ